LLPERGNPHRRKKHHLFMGLDVGDLFQSGVYLRCDFFFI